MGVETDQGILADIVKHRLHVLMKQRQPMLHPIAAHPFGYSFIERITLGGTEQFQIAEAEAAGGHIIQNGL